MSQLGIIIQARTGSSRMPNKIIQPFFNNQCILEILVDRIKKLRFPVVIATTLHINDDIICQIADNNDVPSFRGSENDVLDRFIQTAYHFGFNKIIRVCSDNPFLDLTDLKFLVEKFDNSAIDYLGYNLDNNKPSILSHFGFWAEAVSLNALEKVQQLTSENLYHEHVTNFIYRNPELFKVQFIPVNPIVYFRKDIRMTLDTPEDFKTLKMIFAALSNRNNNFGIIEIVNWLDEHPDIIGKMRNEIIKNQK